MTTNKLRRAIAAALCVACLILVVIGGINQPKKDKEGGQTILNEPRAKSLLNATGEGGVESYVNIAKKQAQEKAKAENAGMAGIREAVAKAEDDADVAYAAMCEELKKLYPVLDDEALADLQETMTNIVYQEGDSFDIQYDCYLKQSGEKGTTSGYLIRHGGDLLYAGFALLVLAGLVAFYELLVEKLGIPGWWGFLFTIVVGSLIAAVCGYLYALLLNRLKGEEMSGTTYVGFSIVSLMCITWLVMPFQFLKLRWPLGTGLRNTIGLDSTNFKQILNNFLAFEIGEFVVPTGLLFFVAPSAGKNLFGDAAIGEYFRVFISYGVIALALVMHAWSGVQKKSRKKQ